MKASDLYPSKKIVSRPLTYTESLEQQLARCLEENKNLDEGWKDTLANIGMAGAIGLGGTAGMMAKSALTPQSAEPVAPIVKQEPAVKREIPQVVAKKVEPSPQAVSVAPITTSPLEKVLAKTAMSAGIKGVELAQFLAQCAHESANFSQMSEFGGSLDFRKYDPKFAPKKAKILGNKQVGDGAKYKGRGFIQITGRYNYKTAGDAIGLPLEKNPELASKPEVAAKIAVWYWKTRVKPVVTDFYDTAAVTKTINSGLRGLKDRHENFKDYIGV